jgi:hypothetical protein
MPPTFKSFKNTSDRLREQWLKAPRASLPLGGRNVRSAQCQPIYDMRNQTSMLDLRRLGMLI